MLKCSLSTASMVSSQGVIFPRLRAFCAFFCADSFSCTFVQRYLDRVAYAKAFGAFHQVVAGFYGKALTSSNCPGNGSSIIIGAQDFLVFFQDLLRHFFNQNQASHEPQGLAACRIDNSLKAIRPSSQCCQCLEINANCRQGRMGQVCVGAGQGMGQHCAGICVQTKYILARTCCIAVGWAM